MAPEDESHQADQVRRERIGQAEEDVGERRRNRSEGRR